MGDFNKFRGNNRSGGRDFGRKGSFGSRDQNRPVMMHQAVCDDCGKSCEVPFKPTGNREIFCSDCFEKRGGKDGLAPRREERSFNNFDREDRAPRNDGYERRSTGYDRNERGSGNDRFGSRDREMFSAICDECGNECQLPFKPSSSKPVYCSKCFEERGERSGLHDKPEYNRNQNRNFGNSSRDNNAGAMNTEKEIIDLKAQLNNVNQKLDKIMLALNMQSEKTVQKVEEKITPEAKEKKVAVKKAVAEKAVAETKEEVVKDEAVANKEAAKKTVKKAVKKVTKKVAAKK